MGHICHMLNRFLIWLFKARDNSPLVVFRMFFGFLLFAEALGAIVTGWVRRAFVEPKMSIPFNGFDWLATLLHGEMMYVWYSIMAVLGLLIMIGFRYKLSMLAYALFWTCTYLIQKTHYNNHYYLMVVLCFVFVLLPAHRYASFDVKRKPLLKRLTCPNWVYVLLIGLFAIVYFYASFNKLYGDWLHATPVGNWFSGKTDYPIIGPLLAQEWMPWVISYGGIVFDGLIIPALLWKRTRKVAFGFNLFFHLFNSAVFQIGVFPYLMIAITVLFFPPETVRRIFLKNKPPLDESNSESYPVKPAIAFAVTGFLLLNFLMPLRHFIIEGPVLKTEEGHRMSWRMMLRSRTGTLGIKLKDIKNKQLEYVKLKDYLTRSQIRTVATHPDALYWFLQKLKKDYDAKGWTDYKIYVRNRVSVNGGEYFYQYDHTKDMRNVEWHFFRHDDWILYEDLEE